MNARKFNRNPAIRKKYGEKIASWIQRAEELKTLIKNAGSMEALSVSDSPQKIEVIVDPMREAEATILLANQKDKEKEFSEAFDLYMQGIDYLIIVSQAEKNPAVKNIINAKVRKYVQRAEQCKLMVKAHVKSTIASTESEKNLLLEFRKSKEKE